MTLIGTKLSLRYLLYWDVKQRWPVVSCYVSRPTCLADPGRCAREVVPKRRQLTTSLSHVTSKKNESIIYSAAKDWNHARFSLLQLCWTRKCRLYTVEERNTTRLHLKFQFLPQGNKMKVHRKDPHVNNV